MLLVEPDALFARCIQRMLRDTGTLVTVCGSAHEALNVLRSRRVDIVWTDWFLGDGATGLSVIRAAGEANPRAMLMLVTSAAYEPFGVESLPTQVVRYHKHQLQLATRHARVVALGRSRYALPN